MVVSSAGMGLSSFGSFAPLDAPPAYEALNLFSLIFFSAMALEWLWRYAWSLREHPAPLKDPTTALRGTIILILLAMLCRVLPDTVQAMVWAESDAAARIRLLIWNERFNALSSIPFALAWLMAYLGGPMILYQLHREPIPLHLWPTWKQVARPAKIASACLALALALTFLR